MVKREVLHQYEERICEAEIEIAEELVPKIEGLEYELKIVQRMKAKNSEMSNEMEWQTQVDVLEMLVGTQQGRL